MRVARESFVKERNVCLERDNDCQKTKIEYLSKTQSFINNSFFSTPLEHQSISNKLSTFLLFFYKSIVCGSKKSYHGNKNMIVTINLLI